MPSSSNAPSHRPDSPSTQNFQSIDFLRTQKETIEIRRKTMKVALPTLAIIAATYIFLSHLPIAAMAISVITVTGALVISYYWVVKPLLLPTSPSTDICDSPPPLVFLPRTNSKSAPPIH